MKEFIIGLLIGVIMTISFAYWSVDNNTADYSQQFLDLREQGYEEIECAYLCGVSWQPLYNNQTIGFDH